MNWCCLSMVCGCRSLSREMEVGPSLGDGDGPNLGEEPLEPPRDEPPACVVLPATDMAEEPM